MPKLRRVSSDQLKSSSLFSSWSSIFPRSCGQAFPLARSAGDDSCRRSNGKLAEIVPVRPGRNTASAGRTVAADGGRKGEERGQEAALLDSNGDVATRNRPTRRFPGVVTRSAPFVVVNSTFPSRCALAFRWAGSARSAGSCTEPDCSSLAKHRSPRRPGSRQPRCFA